MSAAGVVDFARSTLDPSRWVTRLLFWPHRDVVISSIGLCAVAVLARDDRSRTGEWRPSSTTTPTGPPHLRDRHVHDAAEKAQLYREYGRWHQRVEDRIASFAQRFQTEYSAFMTLGGDFPVDVLTGITLEHSRLHSMVELKVSRLRSLIQAIQSAGWND